MLQARKLFTPAQRQKLADTIAATLAPANLLGRARTLERKRLREQAIAEGTRKFSALDPVQFPLPELRVVPPLPPEQALTYFQNLIPSLDATTANLFATAVRRQAFTLAVATEETLLRNVQSTILKGIESGSGARQGAIAVEEVLQQAGVTPSNPQYAEMVYRTNAVDAFNQGAQEQFDDPDLAEYFPVWQYIGILDGRQGVDHEPHFNKYYPRTRKFAEVRGPRVFNCRCTFIAIDKYQWEELQQAGAKVEE